MADQNQGGGVKPTGNEPSTREQTPKQVPNSQGPGTKDTSDNAKTVQHPPRK